MDIFEASKLTKGKGTCRNFEGFMDFSLSFEKILEFLDNIIEKIVDFDQNCPIRCSLKKSCALMTKVFENCLHFEKILEFCLFCS